MRGPSLLILLSTLLLASVNSGVSVEVKVFGMQVDMWAVPTTDVVIQYNLSQRIQPGDSGEYSTVTVCYWAKPTTLTEYETHISLAISDQKNDVLHLYRKGEQHGFYYNGVRQFGFIMNLTTPVGLHEWTHYCHIFHQGQYTGYVNGKKKATGLVDSTTIPLPLRGMITLGQEQDLLAGGYSVKQCFRGYMSQLNIWNQEVTEREINQQANCQHLIFGNIFSSDREELKIFGASVETVDVNTLCEKSIEYVIFPEAQYLPESKLTCKRIGYSVYSPSNTAENTILHNASLPFATDCGSNYHLWIGATDEENEGRWHKFSDNSLLKETPFELFEPNGDDGENCILMFLPNGLWVDTSCAIQWPACVPCEVDRRKPLRLRGLCYINEAETFFEVLGYKGGKPLVHGYYGYMIFRTEDGFWKMYDTTVNETVAVLIAHSMDFYPIGRNYWTLKRPMCNRMSDSEIQLSLTICNNAEFSCSNGDCVPKEKRCDGNNDCSDYSDEESCSVVTVPLGYRVSRHPDNETDGEALHLNAVIHILRFTEISDMRQTLSIELTLQLTWKDSRLNYLNLADISDVNKLSDEEAANIWKPKIKFPNAYNRKTDFSEEVKVDKIGPPQPPNFNDVKMDTVYNGISVKLIQTQQHSGRFTCSFDVFYYPFDVQRCMILLKLASVRKDLVTFSQHLANLYYLGDEMLPEYTLTSFIILATETYSDNVSYSMLQVEMELERRWTVIVLNVYLPTSMLLIIGYSTLFIDFATLDVRLAVSLTTLLVLYSLFSNISSSLPVTAYVKMIDVWFFYCIFLLFSTTLTHVIVECLNRRTKTIAVHPISKTKASLPSLKNAVKPDFLSIVRNFLLPAIVIVCNVIYWSLLVSSRV